MGLRCRMWGRGSGLTLDSINTVPRGRSFLRRSEGPRGGVRPEDRGVSTHDSVGERGSVRGRGWQDPRAGRLQKGRHSVATGSLGFRKRAGAIWEEEVRGVTAQKDDLRSHPPSLCAGCVRRPAVVAQDGGRGWTRRGGVVEIRDWDGDGTAVSDVGERIGADA